MEDLNQRIEDLETKCALLRSGLAFLIAHMSVTYPELAEQLRAQAGSKYKEKLPENLQEPYEDFFLTLAAVAQGRTLF